VPFFHFLGPPAFIVLEVSFWLRFLLPRFAYIEWANAMVPPTSFLGGRCGAGRETGSSAGPWAHAKGMDAWQNRDCSTKALV